MGPLVAALLTGLALLVPSAPPVDTDLDYQLGGASPPSAQVGIVVRDRESRPVPGLWNVCYVNGFQTQPNESRFWAARRGLVLRHRGRAVLDEAWGEKLLDIRTPAKRRQLARIVGRWTERCARDGFDAVEFDNLDSFSRSHGLLKARHARAYARLLTARAHRSGLAVGQKNWAELDGRRLGFDFAIAEECGRYRECGDYVAHYGRAVLVVEYRRRDFRRTCAGYGDELAVVLRDRALRVKGRRDWC